MAPDPTSSVDAALDSLPESVFVEVLEQDPLDEELEFIAALEIIGREAPWGCALGEIKKPVAVGEAVYHLETSGHCKTPAGAICLARLNMELAKLEGG